MLFFGTVLSLGGLGATIYGIHLNNSMEAQLTSLFSSGNVDPGTSWIAGGIAALIVGLILFVFGLVRMSKVPKPTKDCYFLQKSCQNCGTKLSENSKFCPKCGELVKW